MIEAEKILYTIKAGQYLSWSCSVKLSIMDVIAAAALNAIFREG
jgi:hypothetical protein